jgi:dCTP deaminase
MILAKESLTKLVSENFISNKSKEEIKIDPTSISLHLDDQFTIYVEHPDKPVVPPTKLRTSTTSHPDGYVIAPMGRVLACSDEYVNMPNTLMGFIQTKGSIARGFLTVHLCDGQIDPGYRGKITFEIVNFSDMYYLLKPGMAIAQLFVYKLTEPTEEYSGRYQSSSCPTSMS